MTTRYSEIRAFVQHLAPTWRKTQHENFTRVIEAIFERPSLVLSQLARAMPKADQPLHGRLKRLDRFLDNPRLDEAALSTRFLRLAYRFGESPPQPVWGAADPACPAGHRLLRAVRHAGIHRPLWQPGPAHCPFDLPPDQPWACLPPRPTWPDLETQINPPRPRRGYRPNPTSSVPRLFLSQNLIEQELIDYVFSLVSPALWPVLVADRGFARAALLRQLQSNHRDFVIRIDAQTHVRLPGPLGAGRPVQDIPARVLGIEPGQRSGAPRLTTVRRSRCPSGYWPSGTRTRPSPGTWLPCWRAPS